MSKTLNKEGSGKNLENTPIEILSGPEAERALQDVDALIALIRHHADFNFSGPPVNQSMTQEEVARILNLYGYPPSILTQRGALSRILHFVTGFSKRLQNAVSSQIYDPRKLALEIEKGREAFEKDGLKQVNALASEKNKTGDMVVAKVNGKTVGMLGIRKLGLEKGRQVYDHLKASVLPEFENQGISWQMKQKAIQLNCAESHDPLWLVHSKNSKILGSTKKFERTKITFADYARLRGWQMSQQELDTIEEKWRLEGWEYWLVDFQKPVKEEVGE